MECKDKNCPKHGSLATRGMVLDGTVVSAKMQGTVVVQRDYFIKVKKYDRYKRSRSRIPAHNPPCINANEGDAVRIMECKKLGKTVSFVVVEKLEDNKGVKKEKIDAKEEKKPEEPKGEKKKKARQNKVKNG